MLSVCYLIVQKKKEPHRERREKAIRHVTDGLPVQMILVHVGLFQMQWKTILQNDNGLSMERVGA